MTKPMQRSSNSKLQAILSLHHWEVEHHQQVWQKGCHSSGLDHHANQYAFSGLTNRGFCVYYRSCFVQQDWNSCSWKFWWRTYWKLQQTAPKCISQHSPSLLCPHPVGTFQTYTAWRMFRTMVQRNQIEQRIWSQVQQRIVVSYTSLAFGGK